MIKFFLSFISKKFTVLCLIICAMAIPVKALDTSSGVGLQQKALFQEKIDYTLTNKSGEDFHNQDLSNTSFAGAVAKKTDFRNANLRGAIFTQGYFSGANFNGADLSDALMDSADFESVDFRNSILNGVIASGSNFNNAQINGADFTNALIDRKDKRELCLEADGTNPMTGIETSDSLEC